MKAEDYHTTIAVDATAEHAFECINKISEWWTENIEGNSENLNDEFTVRFGDVHLSTQKLIEIIPGKKVVWLVTYSKLNFIKDQQEWNNTRIIFELNDKGDKCQVHFTHEGLSPAIECFDACSNAWSQYIHDSLRHLINTGKGNPNKKEKKATRA